jgi:hypothetical protein
LDLALVDKEQKLVTQFMDEYFINNPEVDRTVVIQQVSFNFNPESGLFFTNLPEVKDSIHKEFTLKNEPFNMGKEEHRVRLGYHLVNKMNNERGQ